MIIVDFPRFSFINIIVKNKIVRDIFSKNKYDHVMIFVCKQKNMIGQNY